MKFKFLHLLQATLALVTLQPLIACAGEPDSNAMKATSSAPRFVTNEQEIEFENMTYKRVTGEELVALIVGHSISPFSTVLDTFLRNGGYVRMGERAPIYGSYTFTHTELCIHYESRSAQPNCFAFFKNNRDEYLYSSTSFSSVALSKVKIDSYNE